MSSMMLGHTEHGDKVFIDGKLVAEITSPLQQENEKLRAKLDIAVEALEEISMIEMYNYVDTSKEYVLTQAIKIATQALEKNK